MEVGDGVKDDDGRKWEASSLRQSPAAFDVLVQSRAGLGIRPLAARIRLPLRLKMTVA